MDQRWDLDNGVEGRKAELSSGSVVALGGGGPNNHSGRPDLQSTPGELQTGLGSAHPFIGPAVQLGHLVIHFQFQC